MGTLSRVLDIGFSIHKVKPGESMNTGQSRKMSIVEASFATATSYCVAIGSQLVIYPYFGIQITLAQNFGLAGAFTLISLVRGYMVRRAFNYLHMR